MASRGFRCFVGNLPWTIGREELRRFAEQFGQVKHSNVVFDRKTGLSKGFGFVTFHNEDAFKMAASSNPAIDGHHLNIQATN